MLSSRIEMVVEIWNCNGRCQRLVNDERQVTRVELKIYTRFARIRLIFLKCCRENSFFHNIMLGQWRWNLIAQQISPAHRTMYFLKLLNTNLFSQTTIPQIQSAFICLNSAILIVEQSANYVQCLKLTIEAPDIVLVFLLFTLNIFDTLF